MNLLTLQRNMPELKDMLLTKERFQGYIYQLMNLMAMMKVQKLKSQEDSRFRHNKVRQIIQKLLWKEEEWINIFKGKHF